VAAEFLAASHQASRFNTGIWFNSLSEFVWEVSANMAFVLLKIQFGSKNIKMPLGFYPALACYESNEFQVKDRNFHIKSHGHAYSVLLTHLFLLLVYGLMVY